MPRTLHKISSALLVALGVVHTALTPMFYRRFTLGALWFAGSGLAMIFVGLLNLTLGREVGRDRLVRVYCHAANLLTLFFGILIVTLDREPQVVFGLVLIVLMTATRPFQSGEHGIIPPDVPRLTSQKQRLRMHI